MNPFTLKVKGRSSIGSVSLGSILGVPFLAEIAEMMSMVLTAAYYRIHFIVTDDSFFNFVKDGGGGCMAIIVYNPWGFAKELWLL